VEIGREVLKRLFFLVLSLFLLCFSLVLPLLDAPLDVINSELHQLDLLIVTMELRVEV